MPRTDRPARRSRTSSGVPVDIAGAIAELIEQPPAGDGVRVPGGNS